MRRFPHVSLWSVVLLAAVASLGARAEEKGPPASVVGTYRNLSFNVNGAGGQNRLMPGLELRDDHTYQWGRESGKYEYRDGRVSLSGSYAAWGPGKVDPDSRIRFEFTKNGKHFTVTMYRVAGR